MRQLEDDPYLAQSEDSDWTAYRRGPGYPARAQAMARFAREKADNAAISWREVFDYYRIRAGYVMRVPGPEGYGGEWYRECWGPIGAGVIPAWIVVER